MSNLLPFTPKQSKAFRPFIFVDTLFVHDKESFFVMGLCENKRTIHISDETLALPKAQQRHVISEMVRSHFKGSGGTLPVWKEIHYYRFFHTAKNAWVFDVSGTFLYESQEELPARATAKVDGKEFELN
ncbi:hypothetical protein KJ365_06620 [Glaciecola sp. XM2]|uniref:hypothetical protein n=1 Tax=Glaciecola sp. XM2 TaxID=1914931 RepID=UPI001BDEA01C|nr:hypothetical protein [Glaciecola sp. XM2]MBT1450551.1 hypothetical protein [Glaciecola sp. XM2]